MEHTIPFVIPIDESLDIGSDTLTGVDEPDYVVPFAFTGKLDRVTLAIHRPQLTPADIEKLKAAEAAAAKAKE
jgi:arylsulfatase